MIKTKTITITKDNQFNKGWTLFKPFNLMYDKNRFYSPISINDVIRCITFASKVDMILSEPCLSSRIIEEIKWVNKYIELNIFAKSKEVLDRYSSLKFSSVKIENTVDFNYIGIQGKQNKYFILDDAFVEIDDSYEKVFFDGINLSDDFSFLKDVREMIVVDSCGVENHSKLIEAAKKHNVEVRLIVNSKHFSREIFDTYNDLNISLLVSDKTKDAVLLIKQDASLMCLAKTNHGFYISYPIERAYKYFGGLYESCRFKDKIETKNLNNEYYFCYRGDFKKLDIKDKIVINLDRPIELMSDFISENFDSKIIESHNDYSLQAKQVDYVFKLIPPSLNDSYVESSIYDDVHRLCDVWDEKQTLNVSKIKERYALFSDKDFGIIKMLDESVAFTKELKRKVQNCSYSGYYNLIKNTLDLFKTTNDGLIEICRHIFESLNGKFSEKKFDKFDLEIESYQKTITEKQALIDQGKDVLNNKRRIEILTDKINKLQVLKETFKSTACSRNDKDLDGFIQRCENILNDVKEKENDDSIGNIVRPKEETKLSKLDSFMADYLHKIKFYLGDSICVLEDLSKVYIPEEYKVYDYGNERFIAISDLSEYETSYGICDEFHLKCVAKEVQNEL